MAPLLDWLNTLGRKITMGIAPMIKRMKSSSCGLLRMTWEIKYPERTKKKVSGKLLTKQLNILLM